MTASERATTDAAVPELLTEAVRVLTAAARRTRPVLVRDEAASTAAGHPVWTEGGEREPADWAEFVTLALAGAAANVGGIETALAGRSGSWEAEGVRQLLTSTVGHDEQYLYEHRTDPLVIDLYVDEILVDAGAWTTYSDAEQELVRRYDALGIPSAIGVPGDPAHEEAVAQLEPATEEQARQSDAIAALEDRLEEQRRQDWAAYGQALKANLEAAAGRVEGLRVPVVVNVDLETFRSSETFRSLPLQWGLAERLLEQAIAATPLPGDGRPPLERLQERPGDPA